jgi:hypothetical protein
MGDGCGQLFAIRNLSATIFHIFPYPQKAANFDKIPEPSDHINQSDVTRPFLYHQSSHPINALNVPNRSVGLFNADENYRAGQRQLLQKQKRA